MHAHRTRPIAAARLYPGDRVDYYGREAIVADVTNLGDGRVRLDLVGVAREETVTIPETTTLPTERLVPPDARQATAVLAHRACTDCTICGATPNGDPR